MDLPSPVPDLRIGNGPFVRKIGDVGGTLKRAFQPDELFGPY
jgi:hypothetical protein